MSANQENPRSPSFKASVALESLRGQQSPAELAQRYGVTEQEVTDWGELLLEGAASLFKHSHSPITDRTLSIDPAELADTIAQNSTQGLVMMDETGHCIYVNRTWLEMTGYSAAEICARPLHELVHHHYPDGRHYPISECPIDRALPENFEVRAHEDVFFRKDGSTFFVQVAASPIFRNGRPVATVIEIRDISERKRTEAALHESRERFRKIVSQAATGVVEADKTGRITLVNRKYCEMLGYEEAELLGIAVTDITAPRFVQQTRDAVTRLAAGGPDFIIEKQYRRKDGSFMWALSSVGALRGAADEYQGMVAIILDITEKKHAEESLRESEERFHTMADNIPQLAWMADSTGDIFWYNNRWFEYTGTTLEEMRGWGWQRVHDPAQVGAVTEKFKKHVRLGEPWEDTFPLRGRDGTYRWFLSRAIPIRDAAGRVTRWFGTNTDITAQRETEQALQETSSRKDEFLAMLAHELRNPLAPINAAADMLSLTGLDQQRVARIGQVITRQVRHMTALVDELLDVSRVTRGLITLDKADLDIRNIVSDAVEQVRPLIEAKRQHLRVDCSSQPLHVSGDRKRLVQVLTNLLDNAAKYTQEQGNIHLEARPENEQLVLRITDDGIGIDPELRPHLFGLFEQAKRLSDRSQGGLGLGLALSKRLVELHGGRITCHSDGKGKGSQFTVILPRLKSAETEASAHSGKPSGHTAENRLRILVVDDNVDAAQTLAMLLEAWGHQVFTEHSPTRALETAASRRPQVCILDIGLPEIDGYELARRLRAQRETAGAVLIALTGYGQEEDRTRAQGAGFDHHLAKPVDIARLAVILQGATGR